MNKIFLLIICALFPIDSRAATYAFVSSFSTVVGGNSSSKIDAVKVEGRELKLSPALDFLPVKVSTEQTVLVLEASENNAFIYRSNLHISSFRNLALSSQGSSQPLIEMSSSKLSRAVEQMVRRDDLLVGQKANTLVSLSKLIQQDAILETYYISLFNESSDPQVLNACVRMLCLNSKRFVDSLSDAAKIPDIKLNLLVQWLDYNKVTASIFREAISRSNDDVVFSAANKLRGDADVELVPQLKRLVLSDSPRTQWAAFMCLSNALNTPIEAPSLEEYIADPITNGKRLGEVLYR